MLGNKIVQGFNIIVNRVIDRRNSGFNLRRVVLRNIAQNLGSVTRNAARTVYKRKIFLFGGNAACNLEEEGLGSGIYKRR